MKRLSPAVKAVRWRIFGLKLGARRTVEQIIEAMSVEGLPYEQIPECHYRGVVAFRKLRQDARERLVWRFFKVHGSHGNNPCVWCSL